MAEQTLENKDLPSYKIWQDALVKLDAANAKLAEQDANYEATRSDYLEKNRIYDKRETLYCPGGASGYSYTILPNTGLTCNSNPANLQAEAVKFEKFTQEIIDLQKILQAYDRDGTTGQRQKLVEAVNAAKLVEEEAKEAYKKDLLLSLSPEELSSYQETINSASNTQTKSKLTIYIIIGVVGAIVLSGLGWIIYKYVGKTKAA